jgi:hypothetical protein
VIRFDRLHQSGAQLLQHFALRRSGRDRMFDPRDPGVGIGGR